MSAIINQLETFFNKDITKRETKYLTAPGDNYGSLMLSVDLIFDDAEEIHAVAKTPPANILMQEMFNTEVTFRNEIFFYKEIVPTLQKFQREQGVLNVINFFPKYYGSRLNLTDIDRVDSDAVLLLENLKVLNYVNAERSTGFGLDVAKLVLADLALLHAVPLALKLKKPKVFDENVRPYLCRLQQPATFRTHMRKNLIGLLDSVDEIQMDLDRVKRIPFDDMYPVDSPREPFATITHNDCWVNNTMQLHAADGKPIENKLVDFQICDYGSPAKDVIFFLFTSVAQEVLKEHCDDLIEYYYEKFLNILKELKVDIDAFCRQAFEEELKYEANKSQFVHILFMMFPILAPKGSVVDFSELDPANISTHKPTELHKERLIFVIQQFIKRNWI